MEQSPKRLDYLDCAHGLMILHMMFFHLCCSTIYGTPYYYPVLHTLSFFMAWFFFKSGMFYKERTIKDTVIFGFKRLLVPALVFSVIGFLCYLIIDRPTIYLSQLIGATYLFGAFPGNTPIWFLFSLFAIQLIFSLLQKCHFQPIVIAIMALGMYFLNRIIGFRPFWAYNIPLGLLFFSLGLLLKDFFSNKIVIVSCLVVYFCLYFIHFEIDFLMGKFDPFFVAIPWALAGCILTNVVFQVFPRLCFAPLRFFGHHAMEFYCTHIIIIAFIEGYIQYIGIHINTILFEFTVFAVYLIVLSLILHFFKLKHIQWMFGRNSKG